MRYPGSLVPKCT